MPESSIPKKPSTSFSDQVDRYIAWKRKLQLLLGEYRDWLSENALHTHRVEQMLSIAQGALQTDRITLAFVGEFSRGKTELINSLFFAQLGQRLLPSRPGRTTMCPTELFFDLKTRDSYIRLLSIKTRGEPESLQALRDRPEWWHSFPLDLNNPKQMAETMASVCDTKQVTATKAKSLGFNVSHLETDLDSPSDFVIPAWRHALISFDHPLLRQGLRIIDTPGLNALGSEPELTFNLLQESHAVLFLMSADTGVTASDLQIWEEHIKDLSGRVHGRMLAVLNKVDTLWDDPEGEEQSQKHLQDLVKHTAKTLQIPADGILTLSAKMGLKAKLTGDSELLNASGLPKLERMLSESILRGKEAAIQEHVIDQCLQLMQETRASMLERKKMFKDQRREIEKGQSQSDVRLFRLNEQVKRELLYFDQLLEKLGPFQQQLSEQRTVWTQNIEEAVLVPLIAQMTVAGKAKKRELKTRLNDFFFQLHKNFQNFARQALKVQRHIQKIYQDCARGSEKNPPTFQTFNVNAYIIGLQHLEHRAEKYLSSTFKLWQAQVFGSQHFVDSLASQAAQICHSARQDFWQWCDQAMTPLIHHSEQRKEIWQQQAKRITQLLEHPKNVPMELDELRATEAYTNEQIQLLEQLIYKVNQFSHHPELEKEYA
ncbi:MAG: dynamin family protein [Pseudomonadota bacterium]